MSTTDVQARAAAAHIVIVGGGVAGLIAARECAKLGIPVTVLEAATQLGGMIRRAELDGFVVDTGAEFFSTHDEAVRVLLTELGLDEFIQDPQPENAWLSGLSHRPVTPLPEAPVAGIPANPFDENARRIIGWRGAWRAYFDRLRPPLTIGHEASLGRLIASRMGSLVRDRLVAPRSLGVWGVHPDELRTDAVVPGLSAALTRAGSLSGAVTMLGEGRAATTTTLRDGLSRLIDALVTDLRALGGRVRTGAQARGILRDSRGWMIELAEGEERETLHADAVIVACDAPTAARLLEGLLVETVPTSFEVEVVTLLAESSELDHALRGSVVFPLPGSGAAATRLAHATAKGEGLRDAASHHLLRVTFGSLDAAPATATLDEEAAIALAATEAEAHFAVSDLAVLAAHRERFHQSLPAAHRAAATARETMRTAILATPGLGATGAWIAGSGLARVIRDARSEAERVRSAVLWESPVSPPSQGAL